MISNLLDCIKMPFNNVIKEAINFSDIVYKELGGKKLNISVNKDKVVAYLYNYIEE